MIVMKSMTPTHSGLRLIQFAKAPQAGRVKTRLIPDIGAAAASRLHLRLVREVLRILCDSDLAPVALHSDDCDSEEMIALADDFSVPLQRQRGDNLGQRMYFSIEQTLAIEGVDAVLLLGSDCLQINRDYLDLAVRSLQSGSDVVIGPARDGGYVLIAMCRAHESVFSDIPWGSERVLSETLQAAAVSQLSVSLLPTLSDIDRAEDLPLLAERGIALPALLE